MNQAHFDTFQTLRGSVKEELKWRGAGPLRDAVALALLPVAVSKPVDFAAIRENAAFLKQNNAKLYFLRSSTRYAVAASLLSENMNTETFVADISAARQFWKELKLRRTSPYEGASLITLYFAGRGAIDRGTMASLKSAFDMLKDAYFWHVGSLTLPALSLAMHHSSAAATDGALLFDTLKEAKFPSQYRMSTALIGTLRQSGPQETCQWLVDAHRAFKANKMRSAAQRTTSLAVASLTDISPEQYVSETDMVRQQLKDGPFRSSNAPALAMNFVNMSRVISMRDASQGDDNLTGFTTIIAALQAYIAMQEQAAMVAVIAASTAGAAAAS
ncbi:DUF4003 family protein [Parvularcula sp. IMCC14364]|uniref:DUF4003 family protein n=1 Tax=Parvularcula sp. IMCC14364 TaxID=3067902 RepID=UPI0027407202|nr:DUF4003 family protein [Parvularcula sp. IMCC14364]